MTAGHGVETKKKKKKSCPDRAIDKSKTITGHGGAGSEEERKGEKGIKDVKEEESRGEQR